jgi:hypothetical protein
VHCHIADQEDGPRQGIQRERHQRTEGINLHACGKSSTVWQPRLVT